MCQFQCWLAFPPKPRTQIHLFDPFILIRFPWEKNEEIEEVMEKKIFRVLFLSLACSHVIPRVMMVYM
jgi:hypothetical protein